MSCCETLLFYEPPLMFSHKIVLNENTTDKPKLTFMSVSNDGAKRKLDAFLKAHKIDKTDKTTAYTHTRIGDKALGIFGGNFHIPPDDMPAFSKLYCDFISSGGNEYLTEKQIKADGCIAIDLDFRYPYGVETRQHISDHYLDFINLYLSELRKVFQFAEQDAFDVFVFEKPNVNRIENKQITKDGIHIIFGIHTPRELQNYLRTKVMARMGDIFGELGLTNPYDEVFDNNVSSAGCNWMLFGSQKPNNEAYEIKFAKTYKFDDGDFCTEIIKFPDYQTQFDRFSVRRTDYARFPLTSNGRMHSEAAKPAPANDIKVVKRVSAATAPFEKAETDYKKVEEFIDVGIFDARAKDYNTWNNMAFALFNGFGAENGLVLFDAFSNRCIAKYNAHETRDKWDRIAASEQPDNKLTEKSIFKWARDDDADAYDRIIDKYKKQLQRDRDENGDDKQNFCNMKNEFEKKHAKIINRALFIKDTDDTGVIMMSRNEMRTSYEHMKYGDKKFIPKWMECPSMRCYDDMNIFPDSSRCPTNMYNLWRPFKIDTFCGEYTPNVEAKNIFLNHIRILCNHEEAVFQFILLWIAHMLQFPATKSIVPTFISKQGSGKGTLMKLMGRLLGETRVWETAMPSRDVWGNFNGMMPSKFLINLNELSRKETMESEGRIKALITDPTLTINPKGQNQYIINSYHRFLITTNNEQPVATSEDDRRNLIIRSSDELKGNTDYFTEINRLLTDDDVIRTVGDAFKTMKVNENFNYPIPRTKYQDDLKEASRPTHELWLIGFVSSHCKESEVLLYPSEVYQDYCEWCAINGFNTDGMNSTKLGIRLNNLFPPEDRDVFLKTEKNGKHRKTFFIKHMVKHFKIEI